MAGIERCDDDLATERKFRRDDKHQYGRKQRGTTRRNVKANLFDRHSEREVQIISQELRSRESSAYSRRFITAKLIAEYMRSAKQSEAVLLQRKKDQEYWAVAPVPAASQPQSVEVMTSAGVKPGKAGKQGTEVPQWKELELILCGAFQ